MKKILLAILSISFLFLTGCNVESIEYSNPNFKEITAEEAYSIIQDKSIIVLDVRTDEEYALGHIDGSVNIDSYNPNFKNLLNALEKDKTYVVYCRSGRRSTETMNLMNDLGFGYVYNLEGGVNSWHEKGLPLIK